MTISLRFAGAAALCAALLLTACAKKTDQTTTTSTDAGAASQSSPASDTSAASASSAPAADATGGVKVDVKSGSNGASGFIDMPVYPGAGEDKSQAISMSQNSGSVVIKVYTTSDDPKKVADWYKSHLPAAWKGGVLTAGDKTVGTFANEMSDGDQSVVVANQDDHTTRIQLTTKHGK